MFLLETIKVKNRQLQNIHWHNERLNHSRKTLFGQTESWDLAKLIDIPTELNNDVYKCRVTYGIKLNKIEFEPYFPKPIRTLKVVYHNDIDYSFKYADRRLLTELYQQRGNCDDILIVKNGLITDTSYCNIAFFDGKKWLTPAQPLLKGSHRSFLIKQKIVQEQDITIHDLKRFQYFKVFNALLHWEEQDSQDISIY